MLYLYCGDNMDIWLDKIDTNSSIDGLDVINKIASDDEVYGEAPIDEEIDEYLYKGFLKLSEDEVYEDNPTHRYWICMDDKKIGYADIREELTPETSKVGGNIGIILLKEYRNKGLGKVVMKKILDEAYNIGMNDILVTTDKDNSAMRGLCKSMGAELTGIDGHCHYWFKKQNKKSFK